MDLRKAQKESEKVNQLYTHTYICYFWWWKSSHSHSFRFCGFFLFELIQRISFPYKFKKKKIGCCLYVSYTEKNQPTSR